MKWQACDRDECAAASTFRAALESSGTGVVARMEGFPDPGHPAHRHEVVAAGHPPAEPPGRRSPVKPA